MLFQFRRWWTCIEPFAHQSCFEEISWTVYHNLHKRGCKSGPFSFFFFFLVSVSLIYFRLFWGTDDKMRIKLGFMIRFSSEECRFSFHLMNPTTSRSHTGPCFQTIFCILGDLSWRRGFLHHNLSIISTSKSSAWLNVTVPVVSTGSKRLHIIEKGKRDLIYVSTRWYESFLFIDNQD